MAAPKKTRTRSRPARAKYGWAAAPTDDFNKLVHYIHYDMDKKDITPFVKTWIKNKFSKEEAKAILANPDYYFYSYSSFVAYVYWDSRGFEEVSERYYGIGDRVMDFYNGLIESGIEIILEKEEAAKDDKNKKTIQKPNPHQRMVKKVNETIMPELLDLEDEWIEGEHKAEFDMYNRMRFHVLSGTAISIVRKEIESWLTEFTDAADKKCEQAVEAYNHLKKAQLNARIKTCKLMLADLDKLKAAASAMRKPRKPKVITADKQVSKINYCKEDSTYKLVSINPATIPAMERLFTFNVKTRILTEYVSTSTKGFEVKGTTLQNIDEKLSRSTRLRKPDEFLPIIQNKTVRQINTAFNKLTTKINVPNGRINKDTILLRTV